MGVKANISFNNGDSILQRASENGDLNIVNILLSHGAQINYKDRFSQTALHMAVKNRHEAVVDFLLLKGAKVNINYVKGFQRKLPSTLLGLAVENNDSKMLQKLLIHKADPHIFDKRGYNPFHLATELSNFAIMKILLNFGANIDSGTHFGIELHTPLHIAVSRRNMQALKFLIANSANINKKDGHDYTPLHWACTVA